MLIVPRGFDQDPPDERIAGLRDAASSRVFATGVLTGDEAQIGHQGASARKPPEVMELGDNDHRGQGVDPAKTAQPGDRLTIRLGLRDGLEGGIQFRQTRLELLNRQ